MNLFRFCTKFNFDSSKTETNSPANKVGKKANAKKAAQPQRSPKSADAVRAKQLENEVKQLRDNLQRVKAQKTEAKSLVRSGANQLTRALAFDPQVGNMVFDAIPKDKMDMVPKSEYLLSLLLPDKFKASIPDDKGEPHVVKPLPISQNVVTVASGRGMFILYPNNPTDLVGYHYTYNGTDWDYESTIRVSQDTKTYWAYARKVSELITIKSTTLPAGFFALNGTFNAVNVRGTLTEFNSFSYDQLLGETMSNFDKVAAQPVLNGVAVLGLMPRDLSYMRLKDASSATAEHGQVLDHYIGQESDNSVYHFNCHNPNQPITTTNAVIPCEFRGDIDATYGSEVTVTLHLVGALVGATPTPTDVSVNIDFLDVFDNLVFSDATITARITPNASSGVIKVTGTTFFMPTVQNMAPVSRISVTATIVPTAVYTGGACVVDLDVMARCYSAGYPGIGKPVTVVQYRDMPAGAVITVGGCANFELIPDKILRPNVDTSLAHPFDGEREYVEDVLKNSEKLGIRTLWKLDDYISSRPYLEEIAALGRHDVARAMDWSPFLSFLKTKALPTALNYAELLVPELRPVRHGIEAIIRKFATPGSKNVALAMDSDTVTLRRWLALHGGKVPSGQLNVVRSVMFPVICFDAADELSGYALYVAVPGNFSNRIPGEVPFTKSPDGYKIYNLIRDEFPVALGMDITLLPIVPNSPGAYRIVEGPVVEGTSCDAAVWLCAHGKFSGTMEFPITGSITDAKGQVIVNPNMMFTRKQSYCHSLGLPLVGNSATADFPVKNLNDLLHGLPKVAIAKEFINFGARRALACDVRPECSLYPVVGGVRYRGKKAKAMEQESMESLDKRRLALLESLHEVVTQARKRAAERTELAPNKSRRTSGNRSPILERNFTQKKVFTGPCVEFEALLAGLDDVLDPGTAYKVLNFRIMSGESGHNRDTYVPWKWDTGMRKSDWRTALFTRFGFRFHTVRMRENGKSLVFVYNHDHTEAYCCKESFAYAIYSIANDIFA